MSTEYIEFEGVSTNNLKSLNVKIPLYKLTSVTGVSGSGKSSLVFDTVYAEAYRRYVESLSSFARQYLKALPKPKVSSVRNLPPAIAVQQSRSGTTNRSTVGTLTELHDLLRVVFTQCGVIYCHQCGRLVEKADPDKLAQHVLKNFPGEQVLFMAPLNAWEGVSDKDLRSLLLGQGFVRIWANGEITRIDEMKTIVRDGAWVLVDRVSAEESFEKRLVEAAALVLKLGRGRAGVAGHDKKIIEFSTNLICCGITYREPTMALFSFNHPMGACEICQGFGSSTELDPLKIIPDRGASLHSKGVICWNFGDHEICYQEALKSASLKKIDVKKRAFSEYSKSEWEWLWHGDGKHYSGIRGYFQWLDSKRYKAHYRIHAARFRKYVVCPSCRGQRLNVLSQSIKVGGLSFPEVSAFQVSKLRKWLESKDQKTFQTILGRENSGQGVEEALAEAESRLGYLEKMGLSYLSLDRSAKTLSGGELQRINMSRCLGSVLTDTLFCLDEPTSGLHARDSENLLKVIYELRDQGNTVLVVEHEKTVIENSDHFIEIGPTAGHEGGYLVFEGKPSKSKKLNLNVPEESRSTQKDFFQLTGASTHNLKNVTVAFPPGKITGVCGVSGSGKTSLIRHTLYPLLKAKFLTKEQTKEAAALEELGVLGSVGPQSLIHRHDDVMMVSQVALGRSSRSTIATYLDVMDPIRKVFANQDLAKRLKLTPGSFSFNSPGGRCENCKGLGTVVEDLSFLGEMEIVCPSCQGARFQESVLSVTYRGKNLIEVLGMTAAEARAFFFDHKSIVECFDAVLNVGMGYVSLGQSTSSFSGGEAQRLKLVQIMRDARKGKPLILIFDEPTTGLSDSDVKKLLTQFRELTQIGHTVIVIEHHLEVLRSCDWLIEVGPEAADLGGQIVYQGHPSGIYSVEKSVTRSFL